LALSYSGSAQNLTGYTFSFVLNSTIPTELYYDFTVELSSVDGLLSSNVLNYTVPGTYTFDLSTAGVNLTAITNITIGMLAQSAGSATVSNFTYTVPAPGAIALLGAAGLVGGRRRRD
jgi:MYXO-CTERM domain-containing protein